MSYGGGGYNQGYSNVPYTATPNPASGGYHGGDGQHASPYNYEYHDSTANLAPNSQPSGGQQYGTNAHTPSSRAAAHFEHNKKGTSKWVKIGVPLLLVVIAAGVVAGILISKNKDKDSDDKAASSGNTKNGDSTSSGASAGTVSGSGSSVGDGRFFSGVDSFFNPIYPKAVSA
jgi:hypothetical protein